MSVSLVGVASSRALPTASTVRDDDDPIRAGFEIRTGLGGVCTIMANANFDGTKEGFVTASHCTTEMGDTSPPDSAWQASSGPYVADEEEDPAYTLGLGPCAPWQSCRYSDAALFEYLSTVDMERAIIANTEFESIDLERPDRSIEDDDPHCPWVPWCTIVGDSVYKIARSTGLTGGGVGKACEMHTTTRKFPGMPDVTKTYICSDRIDGDDGFIEGGDSGSPVFEREGVSDVTLWGIAFSANDDTLPDKYWMSRIDNIRAELGSMGIVNLGPGGPQSVVPRSGARRR